MNKNKMSFGEKKDMIIKNHCKWLQNIDFGELPLEVIEKEYDVMWQKLYGMDTDAAGE